MNEMLFGRVRRRLDSLRAHPGLNPHAVAELRREAAGYAVDESHDRHRDEAIDWLIRAQGATPDPGFARGYSVAWNPYFRSRGWQPSYPETTGYIIPTFYSAARVLGRPELAERATRAAEWEIEIQLESGAVRGGVIGQPVSPAIFNTGQVMFGWLAAYEATGRDEFARAVDRAAAYLVSVQEADGHWRKGNSSFARSDATLYNARVAWAQAEAGHRLGVRAYLESASRNLNAVAALQQPNGWFPSCCLTDPTQPLLHTIAYTVRGLLEGGRILGEKRLVDAAARASAALMATVRDDGWMPGRYRTDWSAAVTWSCLTGGAQSANNWIRLHRITGEGDWLTPVPKVIRFLKASQNRESDDPGLRGGIKGSAPLSGGYGRFEMLNWACKYFVDLMLRDDLLAGRWPELAPDGPPPQLLA